MAAEENDDPTSRILTGWLLVTSSTSPEGYGKSASYGWMAPDGQMLHTSLGLARYFELATIDSFMGEQ